MCMLHGLSILPSPRCICVLVCAKAVFIICCVLGSEFVLTAYVLWPTQGFAGGVWTVLGHNRRCRVSGAAGASQNPRQCPCSCTANCPLQAHEACWKYMKSLAADEASRASAVFGKCRWETLIHTEE